MEDNLDPVVLINFKEFQKRFFEEYASTISNFLKFLNHCKG